MTHWSDEARRLTRAAAGLTLADVMRNQAIIRPQDVALVAGDSSLTYGELNDLSDRLAAGLVALGMRRGDRLSILSRNSLPYALLFHAAAKAGIAIAALNWRSPPAELAKAIALVQPSFVAVSEECRAPLEAVPDHPPAILMERDDAEAALPTFGTLSNAGPRRFEVDPEDIVSIVFTSGTTGDPKAVAISHRALIARAAVMGVDWSLEPGDAFIGWAPLFHISASDYLFTTTVMSGVFVVVDGFDASKVAAIVRQRKIGWLFLVPGTFEPMVEALRGARLPPNQVKVVGVMADLISPDVMAALSEVTGAPFLNSFGMTECGLLPCSPSFLRSRDAAELSLPKTQSAICSVRLVDEDGKDVADGEPGEMWVRGHTVASGYWANDEATRRAFAGGWYHTGDVMRRTADGKLQFVGRISGMIKSGGENIYPAEIERALLSHPLVVEAAAVGVADPKWGETPHAFVALAEGAMLTAEEMAAHLRGLIAGYKIPRAFHVIALADFPRNVTGKIERRVLARRLAR
jgi:fatty-acyl-CoA synthase